MIDKGFNYLIYEDKSDLAFKLFNELVNTGSPGLCITTLYPQKLKKMYGMDKAQVHWLSDSTGDKDTLSPTRLDFEITRVITKFIKGGGEPVLLLDGMAYLSLENDYDKVRKFIKRVNDMASMNDATIMIVINPDSFNKETIAMLEKDFDRVGSPQELTGEPAPSPEPAASAPMHPAPSPASQAPVPSSLRIQAPPESPVDIPVEEELDLEIEDIYLIHRGSGTLIQRRTWREQDLIDPDLIGGMFQAILDFISNSFASDQESDFSRMDVKGYIILIADGKYISEAIVFSGKAEEYIHKIMGDIKKVLKNNIEGIEKQYAAVFKEYSGDVSQLRGTRKALDALALDINKALEPHMKKGAKKRLTDVERRQAQEKYNMAIAAGRTKHYDDALKAYDEALEIDPGHHPSLFNKAVVLQMLGRVAEALTCYDRALQVNPNDSETWGNRGIALRSLGRTEEAIESYYKGLGINPGDSALWSNLGIALRSVGRVKEAIECYDKAIEINPRDPGVWSNKGVVLGSMGLLKEAIECYDKALAIDPGRKLAQRNREIATKELENRNQK
ncbi:MAG: tetratricopeptide repeat protein [Thermoplasmata archaeon]